MSKLWAFVRRNWQLALTYRFTFITDLAQTIGLLICFFFIGKLFAGVGASPFLAAYGGDYFRFIFLGLAFSGFMTTALSSLHRMIYFERENGTLEAILLTPTSFTTLATCKLLWDLLLLAGKVTTYLLLGTLIFQSNLSKANWIAVVPTVLLTLASFFGLGMISAGFFLLTREVSPIEHFMGWTSKILGGVYFPVELLPVWLKSVSAVLPLTYTLEAVRKSMIHGASFKDCQQELQVLFLFCLLLLPLGFGFFRWSFHQARRYGNLGFRN